MKIGGLQKLTLIDYPEKLACTVFLSGCNFRCPWCYSRELVLEEEIEKNEEVTQEYFFNFLKKRQNKLDGVVVCGGEPTLSSGIFAFIEKIKRMGFFLKIDTNGASPEVLEKLIKESMIDYVAMDIKHSLEKEKYKQATDSDVNIKDIKESINIVKEKKVDYEFRTTVVPGIHSLEDIESIAKEIEGGERYFLQNFYPKKTINKDILKEKPFTKEEMKKFKEVAQKYVKLCQTR